MEFLLTVAKIASLEREIVNMGVQVTINDITGSSPFNIYICQSNGSGCFYISTISSFPYTFDVPPPYNTSSSYIVKAIDSVGCSITGFTYSPTPTPTPTPTIAVTPTPTPTPPLDLNNYMCTKCGTCIPPCGAIVKGSPQGVVLFYSAFKGEDGNCWTPYSATTEPHTILAVGPAYDSCITCASGPSPSQTPTQTPSQTPTQTYTPTVTPTFTETPTNTPTQTYTPTLTPTVTNTPSPTPPFQIFSYDVLFIDDNTNFVYKYNPQSNVIAYLFSAQTSNPVSDIASTTDRIFINYASGDIESYSYTANPFNQLYLSTTSFPSYIGNGMCAVDNNTLLVAGTGDVYQLDFTAATGTTLFSLPIDCYCTGDIVYNPTLDQYLVSYTDSNTFDSFVSIYDNTYSIISTINLGLFTTPTYPDTSTMFGLYSYTAPLSFPFVGKIYGMTYELYIYELDFDTLTLSEPIQPTNLTSERSIGTSLATFYVSWPNTPPTFSYP